MKGKKFIEVKGEIKYLNKNGKVSNKQPGGRNVKDCIDSYEDMKRIYAHLIEQKRWNIYLLFVLNYNLSRRIEDLLAAKWSDFFDENWKIKRFWSLVEKKTKKRNDIKLNKAVNIAFKTFFDNENSFEKTDASYNEPIFKQLHGTYRGKVISEEGYRKALIKIEEELKLESHLHIHMDFAEVHSQI